MEAPYKIVSFKVVKPTVVNTLIRMALGMEKHRSLSVSNLANGEKKFMVLNHIY